MTAIDIQNWNQKSDCTYWFDAGLGVEARELSWGGGNYGVHWTCLSTSIRHPNTETLNFKIRKV